MLSLYTAYDLQMDLKEFIKSARKKTNSGSEVSRSVWRALCDDPKV